MRYKTTVEVTNTHSFIIYANSEEEAHEQFGQLELCDFNEDSITNSSIKLLDLESDGF